MRCSINSQAIPDKIHGNSITNNKAKDEGKKMLLVLLYIIWINTFWNLHLVDIAFNNGAHHELDLTQHYAKNNKYYISWFVMYFARRSHTRYKFLVLASLNLV